jgi:hypothetical protein
MSWFDENANFYGKNGEETYSKDYSPLEFLDGNEMARMAKAPVYLVNDILEVDSHGTLLGASQSFKSFMALSLAYSICTGCDFFNHEVFSTGKVIYVCGEGMGALKRRIKGLHEKLGGDLKNLIILDKPIAIDGALEMAKLRAAINGHNPVLVIFDTFSSLVAQTKEDSNSEVAAVLKLIKETCRNGTTSSIVVHHYGKDETKGARGAYAFRANTDFELVMARQSDTMYAVLSCNKMKDGELFKDIAVKADVVDLDMVRQDGKPSTTLVMVPTEYVQKPEKKRLSIRDSEILQALYDAIAKHGEKPSGEIKEKFAGFGGIGNQKQIVRIEYWRKYAYKTLIFERDKEACHAVEKNTENNAKRQAFLRSIKELKILGKIMTYDDYAWTL